MKTALQKTRANLRPKQKEALAAIGKGKQVHASTKTALAKRGLLTPTEKPRAVRDETRADREARLSKSGKLSLEEVREIKEWLASPERDSGTLRGIARMYGVSLPSILAIRDGKSYRHVAPGEVEEVHALAITFPNLLAAYEHLTKPLGGESREERVADVSRMYGIPMWAALDLAQGFGVFRTKPRRGKSSQSLKIVFGSGIVTERTVQTLSALEKYTAGLAAWESLRGVDDEAAEEAQKDLDNLFHQLSRDEVAEIRRRREIRHEDAKILPSGHSPLPVGFRRHRGDQAGTPRDVDGGHACARDSRGKDPVAQSASGRTAGKERLVQPTKRGRADRATGSNEPALLSVSGAGPATLRPHVSTKNNFSSLARFLWRKPNAHGKRCSSGGDTRQGESHHGRSNVGARHAQ